MPSSRSATVLRTVAVIAGAAAAFAPGAPAAQSPPLTVSTEVVERGWVRLHVTGTPGSKVAVDEITGDVVQPITTLSMAYPTSARKRLVSWRCDRLTRDFRLTATLPDGSVQQAISSVTTPRCKRRLTFGALRGRAGRTLTVTVRDRFGVGDVAGQVCAGRSGGHPRCKPVRFAPGVTSETVRFEAPWPGRYRILLRTDYGQSTLRLVRLRRAGGHFRLLATGDSMIQIIDGFLAARLKPKGGRVISDAHISTGISKPQMLDWLRHAAGSARSVKPDVTVVFLGANDGFAFGPVACCGPDWVDAYAQRVATMLRSYARGGAGRVYWLLLPTPRGDAFARVYRAVNAAIVRAAARRSSESVRVIDLRRVFTPGGRFRQSIRRRGRYVSVRQPDGVHLNTSGASIAADVIIGALRSDGYIG